MRAHRKMYMLERIWEERSRTAVLAVAAVAVLAIAFLDWRTKPYFSMGFCTCSLLCWLPGFSRAGRLSF
jgi:hypothetical protein